MLKWATWILQALLASNSLMHAAVMAQPMGPMALQFGMFPVPLRIGIAAVYTICALGLVVPEFFRKARWTMTAAFVLAGAAALETALFLLSERAMAAGSRASIVILLLVFVLLRRRRLATTQEQSAS
ncbi:MAG: hypothetical protein JNM81_11680 [Rhodospirillaceae bacterium]|nr:hypothetical protein [Rhodospirillaceae bacterium]